MWKDFKGRVLKQTAKALAITTLAKRYGVPEVRTLCIKACVLCGKDFLPKVAHQRFCSSLCRKRYEQTYRQQKRRFLRLSSDPVKQDRFNRYMARLNKLREKEGRPPYWNFKEGRPYTDEEQRQILFERRRKQRPLQGADFQVFTVSTEPKPTDTPSQTKQKCLHVRVRRFEVADERKKVWLCVCEDCRQRWEEPFERTPVSSDKR